MSKNTDLRNVDFKTLLENYDAMSEEDTFVVEDYDTFDDDLNEDEMPLSDEEVSAMLDENEFGDLHDDEFELDLGLDSNEPRFRERTGFGDIDNEDDEFDEALNSMSLEELMDLRNKMQEDDGGDGESYQDGDGGNHSHRGFAVEAGHDYLNENKEMFTEEEINDILEGLEKEDMKEEDEKTSEKEEEKIEENHSSTSQTKKQIGGAGVGKKEGKPERRSNLSEEMEALKKENADLKSKLKTLEENSAEKEKETETLKESFNTKIKTFEDKIKEITLTTYKAAHANKLLLEHTMTHSDKTNVLTQLTNATTKQEVIDTYNTLLQEFSNKKTGKDGLLNESIENRVNKVYRTDKVILSESETTYADRFKQLIAKKQIKNNKK